MPTSSILSINCVLFDLDGTLVDTAPDLVNALNAVLLNEGHTPYQCAHVRHTVSHGSLHMLRFAFGENQTAADLRRRQQYFLDHYLANICCESKVFTDMMLILQALAERGMPWGIVTNKPTYLTHALLAEIRFPSAPQSVVCGDTLAVAKPEPEPMLLAAQQCQVLPNRCLYVGDAERDILAGRRAGMRTLAAAYGYVSPTDSIETWQADGVLETPLELLPWIT